MAEKLGRVIEAATDGACSGNPGPGGWAVLIRFEDGKIEEFGGYETVTTNNRMELQAALSLFKRLKNLPRHPDLKIRSDSKYLIDGLDKWIHTWKRKGWRTASGKPVLNQDLWQALDQERLENVQIIYVKGHSGDLDNDRVDEIAVSYSKGLVPVLRSFSEPIVSAQAFKKHAHITKEIQDPAPLNIQQVFSKLELVNKFAEKGYGLSATELADLIDESIAEIRLKTTSWRWRDWIVEPLGVDRWRLVKQPHEFEVSKEKNDG